MYLVFLNVNLVKTIDKWKTLLDAYYCMWDYVFLKVPLTASYNFGSGTAFYNLIVGPHGYNLSFVWIQCSFLGTLMYSFLSLRKGSSGGRITWYLTVDLLI